MDSFSPKADYDDIGPHTLTASLPQDQVILRYQSRGPRKGRLQEYCRKRKETGAAYDCDKNDLMEKRHVERKRKNVVVDHQ